MTRILHFSSVIVCWCAALLLTSARLGAQTSSLNPTGTVVVTVNAQALIYVDGGKPKAARANERVSIPRVEVGRHIIEVRASGYENYLSTVTVVTGQAATVTATLVAKGPEIKLNITKAKDYKDPLASRSPEQRAAFAQIGRLTANQEFSEARKLIKPLLDKDASDPIANYYLANVLLEEAINCGCSFEEQNTRYLTQALPRLERGTEKGKPFALSLLGTARYYSLLKDFPKVKEYANKTLELESDNVDVLTELADVYLGTQSRAGIDEATTLLSKAELLDAKRANVQVTLGDAWLAQGVNDIALQKYEKAISLDPKQVRAHYRLGQFYREQKKYQEAANSLKQALDIDPKFAPAYAELGEVWFRAKQYGAAKENYRKYVEIRGNDLSARYRYAQFLYLAQDYTGAVTEIKALQKDTTTNLLFRLLGYSSYEAGNLPEAKTAMATYFANSKPEFIIAKDYEYRGKIAIKDGRFAEGIADIEKALDADPTREDLFAEAIRGCIAAKQPARGLALARKAVAAEPGLQNYVTLAGALRQQPRANLQDSLNIATAVDSAFAKACELSPRDIRWPLERARNSYIFDPETEKGTTKPYYEQALVLAEKSPDRYKKELIEIYSYLGYCYHNVLKDDTKALEYLDKVLVLDPADARAKRLAEYVRSGKK